ncbi:MAG: hypothetical protein L0312_26715 [Acidobacteria bacterium]|nr:hypothetical protein [Acidobacteriota bacterium]
MHVLLLIWATLFLAGYRVCLLPVAAITEILCLIRDKWLEPIERELVKTRDNFAEEVYPPDSPYWSRERVREVAQ